MDVATARAMIPEILLVMENIGPEWSEAFDMKTGSSQICNYDPRTGEIFPLVNILKTCPSDARELMRKAPTYIIALLMLRDEGRREYRKLLTALEAAKKTKPEGDYAAECAMKCDDPLFKAFLRDELGFDISDKERIAVQVRTELAITSRGELNKDAEAATRWFDLRARFDAWKLAA